MESRSTIRRQIGSTRWICRKSRTLFTHNETNHILIAKRQVVLRLSWPFRGFFSEGGQGMEIHCPQKQHGFKTISSISDGLIENKPHPSKEGSRGDHSCWPFLGEIPHRPSLLSLLTIQFLMDGLNPSHGMKGFFDKILHFEGN